MNDDVKNAAEQAVENINKNTAFQQYMNQLSANINMMLNPDGEKKVGFSLFIFDATKENPTVSHMSNMTADDTYTVVAPWAVRHKHMKLKKERRE